MSFKDPIKVLALLPQDFDSNKYCSNTKEEGLIEFISSIILAAQVIIKGAWNEESH